MQRRSRRPAGTPAAALRMFSGRAVATIAALSMCVLAACALPPGPDAAVVRAAAHPRAAAAKISWPAFDGGGARSGTNPSETTITPATVSSLGRLWQTTLPAIADSSPIYEPNVVTASGIRDLLFVTTKTGSLLALDANTGALVWQKDHPAGTCTDGQGTQPCYTDSSPALDPSGVFVYTYGLDGYIHKHAVSDGSEVMGGGWPELVTLKQNLEKGSGSLNVATLANVPYLYMSVSGFFDSGDYQGHIVAINLSTGTQTVFNALCSDQPVHFVLTPGTPDCSDTEAGVWGRATVVADPITGNVFFTSGNGTYDPTAHDYGDSVVELHPDGTGNAGGEPVDSYTPSNYAQLQSDDLDLGSTAVALLPQQPSSLTPYMAVQSGKDSMVRLLNRQNLSGQGGPDHTGGELQLIALPQGGMVRTQPAVWTDPSGVTWVFIVDDSGLSAFTLRTDTGGHSTLQLAYTNGYAGSSPLVAGGVLYIEGYGTTRALNPLTGNLLWNASNGGLHWQSPIVVNGHLYAADNSGTITCYALTSPPRTWYFADGYTGGNFTTYLTLSNPGNTTANVTVEYVLAYGSPFTRGYTVAPGGRTTINVNGAVGSGIDGQSVALEVQSDQPIVAERPMYFTYSLQHGGATVPGGTDVVGATALDTLYRFAYLDTTAQHDTYLSVLNPNDSAMSVTVTYHSADGSQTFTSTHTVQPTSRHTIYVNADVGLPPGVYSASVHLSLPGLVERPLYFVDATTGVTGAADVMGQTFLWSGATFAEGYTGSGFHERYLLANPGPTTVHATVRFFDATGVEHDSAPVTLAGYAQASVDANALLGPGVNNAAEVTADGAVLSERLMTFAYSGPIGSPPANTPTPIPGATDVVGVPASSPTFSFAEGYTGGQFAEYLTVFNPDTSTTVNVTVTFLPQNGGSPVTRAYTVGPGARFTLNTATVLGGQSFGMRVTASGPIVAERPMYFDFTGGGTTQTGGTCVAGYPV